MHSPPSHIHPPGYGKCEVLGACHCPPIRRIVGCEGAAQHREGPFLLKAPGPPLSEVGRIGGEGGVDAGGELGAECGHGAAAAPESVNMRGGVKLAVADA